MRHAVKISGIRGKKHDKQTSRHFSDFKDILHRILEVIFGQFHPSGAMLSHSQPLARLAAACANRFSTSTAPAFFWNKDKSPNTSTTDKTPEDKAFQFDLVVPGRVSPQVRPDQFPRDIRLPVYAESGVPGPSPRAPDSNHER